jgi:nucleosome binding factor SPN SPT16 subunit
MCTSFGAASSLLRSCHMAGRRRNIYSKHNSKPTCGLFSGSHLVCKTTLKMVGYRTVDDWVCGMMTLSSCIFDGRKAEMMCTHVCLILSKMVHINVYSYTLQIITPKNGFKVLKIKIYGMKHCFCRHLEGLG